MERIEIRTFRQILERNYKLDCWCPGCKRWAKCDLAMLVRNGLGDQQITQCWPRCRKCGTEGYWQVVAPAPTFEGFATWGSSGSNPPIEQLWPGDAAHERPGRTADFSLQAERPEE